MIFLTGQVQAGAWLRDSGTVFLSPSLSFHPATDDQNPLAYSGLYMEVGLSPALTLGVNLGHAATGSSRAMIFARVPLMETPQGLRMAADLGLGLQVGVLDQHSFLHAGLSLGYGFNSGGGTGWLGLDLSADIDEQAHLEQLKLDMTAGLSLSADLKIMLQTHSTYAPHWTTHQVVPSIVLRSNDRQFIQMGAVLDRHKPKFKLAFWQEF